MFGQGQKRNVALPSHCLPLSFTLVTFDSVDHQDKNIVSGNASAHDTAVTIFQEKPDKPLQRQLKNKVPLCNVTTFKLQESFSLDKEQFPTEKKKSRDHEQMNL